jgi:hypothetical protein
MKRWKLFTDALASVMLHQFRLHETTVSISHSDEDFAPGSSRASFRIRLQVEPLGEVTLDCSAHEYKAECKGKQAQNFCADLERHR